MLEEILQELKKRLYMPLMEAVYDAMKIGADHLTMSRRLVELLADKFDDPTILDDYDTEFTKAVDSYNAMYADMNMEELMAYLKKKAERNRKENN